MVSPFYQNSCSEEPNAYYSIGELLLQDQSLVALNKPASRDLKSVQNYMFDKKPLLGEEGAFIREKGDLITLRDGRELALLDGFMERLLRASHCSLVQVSHRNVQVKTEIANLNSENLLFKGKIHQAQDLK